MGRIIVPEQLGQTFLPASYDCYPPPPPPPPIVDPPHGGGGSGPPSGGGCYEVIVYVQVILCGGYPEGDPLATYPCVTTDVPIGTIEVCP
jgi:hypothetical protein